MAVPETIIEKKRDYRKKVRYPLLLFLGTLMLAASLLLHFFPYSVTDENDDRYVKNTEHRVREALVAMA
jgi:hypothetical protein